MSRFKQWLDEQKNNTPKSSRINELVHQAMNKEELIQEGKWLSYNNKIDYRIDNRPEEQGGLQIHLRDRSGRESAIRYDGSRSEPNKYGEPTSSMKDAAIDLLSRRGHDGVHIESFYRKFEGEVLYESFDVKLK